MEKRVRIHFWPFIFHILLKRFDKDTATVIRGHYMGIGLNYIIHTFRTMTQDLPKATRYEQASPLDAFWNPDTMQSDPAISPSGRLRPAIIDGHGTCMRVPSHLYKSFCSHYADSG